MPDHPNVVLVSAHDLGRHVGCYGVETVRTPGIDGLAADGYRFTDFFAAAPQCTPSRGALLTGRYPQSNGLLGLTNEPWGFELGDDEVHLAARLRDAGYHTALFGLQHEARDSRSLGFESVGHGQSMTAGDARPAVEVARAFEGFVGDADQPFYAQVGFFEAHRPLDFGGAEPDRANGVAVPPYLEDNEIAREEFAALQGAIRALDEGVGIVRDALEAAGLAEDTILVFTADHGISFSRAKGYCYDAGIGVPLLVRWPGGDVAGGETCDWLASNVDVVPTLLSLLDLPIPDEVQGRSLAGAFEGDGAPPRDAVFAAFHDHSAWGFGPHARCIRTRDHKLIRNFGPDRAFAVPIDLGDRDHLGRSGLKAGPRPPVELYDLEDDPDEFENVADNPAYASVREDLDGRLRAWLDAVEDPVLDGPPASPYFERALGEGGGERAKK